MINSLIVNYLKFMKKKTILNVSLETEVFLLITYIIWNNMLQKMCQYFHCLG